MTLTDLLSNPVGTAYKIIGFFLFSFALVIIGALLDRNYFNKYKGEVKGIAEVQKQQTKIIDQQNKEAANVSLDQYHKDTQAINAWYHTHPIIRVSHDDSCGVPKAVTDSIRTYDPPSGFYVSPYDPQQVEMIAVRLKNLQDRLMAGVRSGTVVIQ